MTIQSAIQKAVEGGYPEVLQGMPKENIENYVGHTARSNHSVNELILNPLFWQALGKSMGWFRMEKVCRNCKEPKPLKACQKCGCYSYELVEEEALWRHNWHRLIDHLAEGGTIEDYFARL